MSIAKTGFKHSEETKKKIGDAERGEKNHNYGKHLTEEQKANLSKKMSGENAPNYGKKFSQEHRDKISKALTGENNPMYAKHLSDEHKQKIRNANTGRKHTEEAKRKIRESHGFPVRCVETGKIYCSVAEAERQTLISNIWDACSGSYYSAGGFH